MLCFCAKKLTILVLFVIALSGMCLPILAQQPIIQVVPGESIQAAIDTAPDRAILQLADGVYKENLTILGSMTLRGNPQSPSLVVIKAKTLGPLVTIAGTDFIASVEGVALSGAFGYTAHGIVVYGSAGLSVNDTIISACKEDGISFDSSGRLDVRDCEIRGNRQFGIVVLRPETTVTGEANIFSNNGADLGFYAPAFLRKPLVEPSGLQTVRVPEDCATIQKAVDAVAEYGTIVVGAGQYAEGLTLWKPLTLRGQGIGKTTLRPTVGCIVGGSVPCSVKEVTIEQVTLTDGWWLTGGQHTLQALSVGSQSGVSLVLSADGEGFFEGVSVTSVGGDGLLVTGQAVAHLSACTFTANYYGIHVEEQGSVNVEDCRFEESRLAGLMFSGEIAASTIRSTDFVRNHVGILQEGNGSVSAEHCTFEASGRSAIYNQSGTIQLTSCTIGDAEASAIQAYGGSTLANRCEISGIQETAVYAGEAAQMELVDCVITENFGYGLSAGGSSQVALADCEITLNGLAGGGGATEAGVRVSDAAIVTLDSCSIGGNAGCAIVMTLMSKEALLNPYVTGKEPPRNELYMSSCRVFENGLPGIRIFDAKRVVVTGSQFQDGYGDGMTVESDCDGEIELIGCEFTDNLGSGFDSSGESEILIHQCSFLRNCLAGLMITGTSTVSVNECDISENYFGIGLSQSPSVQLTDCDITGNFRYGLFIFCPECTGGASAFAGELTGRGNWIPGSSDLNGNGHGGICPEGWEFLLQKNPETQEG